MGVRLLGEAECVSARVAVLTSYEPAVCSADPGSQVGLARNRGLLPALLDRQGRRPD